MMEVGEIWTHSYRDGIIWSRWEVIDKPDEAGFILKLLEKAQEDTGSRQVGDEYRFVGHFIMASDRWERESSVSPVQQRALWFPLEATCK